MNVVWTGNLVVVQGGTRESVTVSIVRDDAGGPRFTKRIGVIGIEEIPCDAIDPKSIAEAFIAFVTPKLR